MKHTPLLIPPTLDEIKLAAAKSGLPEIEAEKFFHYYASQGWKVGKCAMKSWLDALAGWRLRWRERQAQSNGHVGGAQLVTWQKEYERVVERLKAIPRSYDEHRVMSQVHKDEMKKLVSRRNELREKLGIMI